MVNDGRIPRGLLLEGKVAIRNALKEFELARSLDKDNEKRPLPRASIVRETHNSFNEGSPTSGAHGPKS